MSEIHGHSPRVECAECGTPKKTIEDGGAAFPIVITSEPDASWQVGLTKREWFAAMASDKDVSMAAQALLAITGLPTCSNAEARYFHADQMIEAGRA